MLIRYIFVIFCKLREYTTLFIMHLWLLIIYTLTCVVGAYGWCVDTTTPRTSHWLICGYKSYELYMHALGIIRGDHHVVVVYKYQLVQHLYASRDQDDVIIVSYDDTCMDAGDVLYTLSQHTYVGDTVFIISQKLGVGMSNYGALKILRHNYDDEMDEQLKSFKRSILCDTTSFVFSRLDNRFDNTAYAVF